jgi:hypothetical protein
MFNVNLDLVLIPFHGEFQEKYHHRAFEVDERRFFSFGIKDVIAVGPNLRWDGSFAYKKFIILAVHLFALSLSYFKIIIVALSHLGLSLSHLSIH